MRRLRIIGDEMPERIDYRHEESADPEVREAYKCGFEDGYEEAMAKMGHGGYGERVTHMGGPGATRILYREGREPERRMGEGWGDDVVYRRRRANGRYY